MPWVNADWLTDADWSVDDAERQVFHDAINTCATYTEHTERRLRTCSRVTHSFAHESLARVLSCSFACSLAHESLACVLSCSFCMLSCSRVTHYVLSCSSCMLSCSRVTHYVLICSRVTRTCAQLLTSCLWVTHQHQNWQTHMAALGVWSNHGMSSWAFQLNYSNAIVACFH